MEKVTPECRTRQVFLQEEGQLRQQTRDATEFKRQVLFGQAALVTQRKRREHEGNCSLCLSMEVREAA
jgi:hypothetical protein